MKAIQIQFEMTWFGVEFHKDLFLTDDDVKNILECRPNKYQGYYTRIHKVSELHTKKLMQLAKKYNRDVCFKILEIK